MLHSLPHLFIYSTAAPAAHFSNNCAPNVCWQKANSGERQRHHQQLEDVLIKCVSLSADRLGIAGGV